MERQPDAVKGQEILELAITSDTTTSSSVIDTKGFNGMYVFINSQTITDGTYVTELKQSDDAGFASPTDVPSDEVSILPTFDNTESDIVKDFASAGKDRYKRVDIVSSGTTSGGTLRVSIVLTSAAKAPQVEPNP